jgi:hypothetical protein
MRWTRQRWACDGVAGRIDLRERNSRTQDDGAGALRLRLRRDWYQARRAAFSKGGPRTVKSCGPDASTLASSPAEARSAHRAGQNLHPRGDGGKTARSPGRSRSKPLKPLRAGMPGDSGASAVNTRVHLHYTCAHEAAGALGTRHSPRPPDVRADDFWQSSGV